jgi:acyl-CoA thioesterase-2
MNEPSRDWDERDLEGALRLDALGDDRFANPRCSPNMNGAIFGGQFIANALTAAMLTAEGRRPVLLQGLFLRPGQVGVPLELAVERVQDGRRLSHRQVEIRQGGRRIFSAHAYLADASVDGEEVHQRAPRHLAPDPDTLPELQGVADRLGARLAPELARRLLSKRSVLVKPVDSEAGFVRHSAEARLAAWFKPARTVGPDPLLQYAALTFISDFWLCWPTRSQHVESVIDPRKRFHSLDHAIWYHAPPSVDDWLLYEVESPAARAGFGLGRGALYRRDGVLLATTAQQALLD